MWTNRRKTILLINKTSEEGGLYTAEKTKSMWKLEALRNPEHITS